MNSEAELKKIKESIGGLVWVRRRNGSWWPGRILGLHELGESFVVSPRSGTPVKLLGREDASVDWYNLEKSKRVKPFRCGEYDECIEKAKASAANSNRKAVKYARREDAIIHALEIEGTRSSDKHHVSQSGRDISSGVKDNLLDERKDLRDANPVKDVNPTKELSQSGISFEDPDHVSTSQIHSLDKKRRKTPNDSEDDGTEGTKRMRGLEDLGMGVLSKRKANVHPNSEESQELVQLDNAVNQSSINSLCNGSAITRSKGSCSVLRNGQSHVAIPHENVKRKDRRRPLTKVLESTLMVSVPVLCDQSTSPSNSPLHGATDSKVSALDSLDPKDKCAAVVVKNNSDCTRASCDKDASEQSCDAGRISSDPKSCELSTISEPPVNGTDGLFDVPFVGDVQGTPGFSPVIALGAPIKQSNERLDESGSTSLTVNLNNVGERIEKGTSKWQSKGKRNSRNRSHEANKSWNRSPNENALPDISFAGAHHTDRYSGDFDHKAEIKTLGKSLTSENCVRWNNQMSDPDYMDSIGSGRRSSIKREGSPFDVLSHEKSAMTKDLYSRDGYISPSLPQRSLPYRSSRFTPHPKYLDMDVPERSTFGGSLFDVNLEVRASYQGHHVPHVPLVSLMSKLNGKAIVGHPVTIEVWNTGYFDRVMSTDCCPTSSSGQLYGVPTSVQCMDVPGYSALLDRSVKHGTGSSSKSCPVKQLMRVPYSPSPKKSPKSRKSILLSKKTRKLSSFTVAPKQIEECRMPVIEKSGGPVVACIPIKVVFSRLHEALNHSTRSPAVRTLTACKP